MPKLPPGLRRNLILLGVLAAVVAGVALTLLQRQQGRERHVAACRQKRSEIRSFRQGGFDAQLSRMRRMRLNPEQVATLRRVDPEAYARYAQAFGDQVDQVAQAADRLSAMVDAYRAADCLTVEAEETPGNAADAPVPGAGALPSGAPAGSQRPPS